MTTDPKKYSAKIHTWNFSIGIRLTILTLLSAALSSELVLDGCAAFVDGTYSLGFFNSAILILSVAQFELSLQ